MSLIAAIHFVNKHKAWSIARKARKAGNADRQLAVGGWRSAALEVARRAGKAAPTVIRTRD
jgi:hypothetical protein